MDSKDMSRACPIQSSLEIALIVSRTFGSFEDAV